MRSNQLLRIRDRLDLNAWRRIRRQQQLRRAGLRPEWSALP
jgi:hypothetical protein